MRIAICTDDPSMGELLKKWTQQYCELYQIEPDISLFSDAEGLLNTPDSGGYHTTFVRLRGPEGFHSARRLREERRNSRIIFVADTMEYAIPCIRLHFTDYLVMPLTFRSFTRAAQLAGIGK